MEIVPSVRSLAQACAATGRAAFESKAFTTPTTMPMLPRTVTSDLISTLVPRSAAAKILASGLRLKFDSANEVAVPTLLGDSTWAVFVKEGDSIPVVSGTMEPLVVLRPRKLAAIVVMTREMVRSSNFEVLVTDALLRSVGLALDKALLDDIAGDESRPAGLRYGVAPETASTAPDPNAALMQDIEILYRAIAPVSMLDPLFVASKTRALMADLRSFHGLAPLVFAGSAALRGTMIMMAIAPENIVSITDGAPEITVTREAALAMDTLPGTQPTKSIWQTDCVALLVRLPVTWGVRSSSGIAWMVTTNW